MTARCHGSLTFIHASSGTDAGVVCDYANASLMIRHTSEDAAAGIASYFVIGLKRRSCYSTDLL